MNTPLPYKLGNEQADRLLKGSMRLLQTMFPNRIRACYLMGSFAQGTAVSGSDLDIIVVFKGEMTEAEADQVRALRRAASMLSPVRLDFSPRGEAQLIENGATSLKLGGKLIYGKNIREQIPLEPLETYRADMLAGLLYYLRELRRFPDKLIAPLTYPDPNGRFFGYDYHGIWHGDDRYTPSTRLLISSVTLAAAVSVLIAVGERPSTKLHAIQLYQIHIQDEWGNWLLELYERCKMEWGYFIPKSDAEQTELRNLLTPLPEFENLVLHRSRPYISTDLPITYLD